MICEVRALALVGLCFLFQLSPTVGTAAIDTESDSQLRGHGRGLQTVILTDVAAAAFKWTELTSMTFQWTGDVTPAYFQLECTSHTGAAWELCVDVSVTDPTADAPVATISGCGTDTMPQTVSLLGLTYFFLFYCPSGCTLTDAVTTVSMSTFTTPAPTPAPVAPTASSFFSCVHRGPCVQPFPFQAMRLCSNHCKGGQQPLGLV